MATITRTSQLYASTSATSAEPVPRRDVEPVEAPAAGGWALLLPEGYDPTRYITRSARPVSTVLTDPAAALALLVTGQVAGVILVQGLHQLGDAGVVEYESIDRALQPERPRRLHPADQDRPRWVKPLTPSEAEVLDLAEHGLSGPAIAERFGITEGTVRNVLGAARRKSGTLSSRPARRPTWGN